MTTRVSRRQSVFDAVFAHHESPFVAGAVVPEELRPQEQRMKDIVMRVLKPDFGDAVTSLADVNERNV